MQMSGNSALSLGEFFKLFMFLLVPFFLWLKDLIYFFKKLLCLPNILHFSVSLHYHNMLETQEIRAVRIPHHGLI